MKSGSPVSLTWQHWPTCPQAATGQSCSHLHTRCVLSSLPQSPPLFTAFHLLISFAVLRLQPQYRQVEPLIWAHIPSPCLTCPITSPTSPSHPDLPTHPVRCIKSSE